MIPPKEGLQRLKDGNHRFRSGNRLHPELIAGSDRRLQLVQGQEPFAVILGCSDSRVPAELIFDQGLGDLFVIRVAGNIAEPSQIGSIEFAVERLGARLVVVLGHSRCGAVQAALKHLQEPEEACSSDLLSILDSIRPGLEPLLASDPPLEPEELIHRAVRSNIRRTVDRLLEQSEPLARMDGSRLQVVGAEYSLDSGNVTFLARFMHEGP